MSKPLVIEDEPLTPELARAFENAARNRLWFNEHVQELEVYKRYRGKYVASAGGELFVADTAKEVRRVALESHPDDLAHSRLEMQRLGAGEISGFQLEKRYIHADGHTVWVALSVSLVAEPDGENYLVGQVEDITQRKAIAEHLEHSAVHDALTGLPNRARLWESITFFATRSSACASSAFQRS